MRKLIGKYTLIMMLVFSILSAIIFFKFINFRKAITEIAVLDSTVEQVVSILELNEEKDEKAEALFEQAYVNRAKNLAYTLLETFDNNPSADDLRQLAARIEVDDIHIVDENGILVESSDEGSLGIDFHDSEKLRSFLPLIESENQDDSYIQMEGVDFSTDMKKVYIGVKPVGNTNGMIQIEVSPDTLLEYMQASSISSVIESMPIRDYVTIYVIDKETGELLGVSKDRTARSGDDMENLVKTLSSYVGHSGKVTINHDKQLISVREYAGNLVCVTSELSVIYSSTVTQLIIMCFLNILLIAVAVFSLYKLIDHFVLHDIEDIISGMYEFLNGDIDVRFSVSSKTELRKMAEGLNKWVDSYESKSERISKIVSMMGNSFATYEYDYDLNQVFFSDNLPGMLELTKEECEQLIRERFSKVYEEIHIYNSNEKPLEDIYITKSGRQVIIQRMVSINTYYAIIRDVSEEREEHEKLSDALHEANKKAARDVLTGLYNREKAEEIINSWFATGWQNGVMLLMDLDNFKKVNDQKGHPEGDKLLKKFADILRSQFRDDDMKARIGGDEFIVFMPNIMSEDTLEDKLNELLDTCRRELKEYYLEQKVSISVGGAYIDYTMHSYAELYQCADSAMYVAKRQGKDGYYINEDHVTCMRSECIHCRRECKRRKALFQDSQ